MSVEVIGIDHIYVSVSDFRCSEKFYDKAMAVLGFRKNTFRSDGDPHIQCLHSERSATMASIFAARRAGIDAPRSMISIRPTSATAKVRGSVPGTP